MANSIKRPKWQTTNQIDRTMADKKKEKREYRHIVARMPCVASSRNTTPNTLDVFAFCDT